MKLFTYTVESCYFYKIFFFRYCDNAKYLHIHLNSFSNWKTVSRQIRLCTAIEMTTQKKRKQRKCKVSMLPVVYWEGVIWPQRSLAKLWSISDWYILLLKCLLQEENWEFSISYKVSMLSFLKKIISLRTW